jgi:hypothetical protein
MKNAKIVKKKAVGARGLLSSYDPYRWHESRQKVFVLPYRGDFIYYHGENQYVTRHRLFFIEEEILSLLYHSQVRQK